MPIIKIPSPLQPYVESQRSLMIEGSTIEEVFSNLTTKYPGIRPHLFDPERKFRSFISIFLRDVNVKDLKNGMKSRVAEDDELTVIASMAGG
jgi:molybdopterin converting factor small subunit